jgi:hypothetical protein
MVNGLRAAGQLLDQLDEKSQTDDTRAIRSEVEKLSEQAEPKAIGLVARDVLRGLARTP